MGDVGAQVDGGAPEVRIEELGRALLDGVTGEGGRRVRADVGLIPVFADERPLLGLAGLIDWRISGRLSQLVRTGMCSGRSDDALLMPGKSGLPADRLILVGVGLREEFDEERAADTARRLVDMALDLRARDVLIAVPAMSEQRDGVEALCVGIDRELARRWRELEQEVATTVSDADVEPIEVEDDQRDAHGDHELGSDERDSRRAVDPSPADGEESPLEAGSAESAARTEESEESDESEDDASVDDTVPESGEDDVGVDPTVMRESWEPPDGADAVSSSQSAEDGEAGEAPDPVDVPADPAPAAMMPGPWWIAAEPDVVVRLRSLLGGSLRAAEGGLTTAHE